MNITCPYCHSENVSRVVNQQSYSQGSLSSMTCAGIGASISKSLPMPISPWMGGIAGAVVGGLIDSFIQPSRPVATPVRYFHCHHWGFSSLFVYKETITWHINLNKWRMSDKPLGMA